METMNADRPIRVMMVDDQQVVRSGLGAFLIAYDDLELVAEADSGEKAFSMGHQYHPDVIKLSTAEQEWLQAQYKPDLCCTLPNTYGKTR